MYGRFVIKRLLKHQAAMTSHAGAYGNEPSSCMWKLQHAFLLLSTHGEICGGWKCMQSCDCNCLANDSTELRCSRELVICHGTAMQVQTSAIYFDARLSQGDLAMLCNPRHE